MTSSIVGENYIFNISTYFDHIWSHFRRRPVLYCNVRKNNTSSSDTAV
jgi:hypothetical protein